MNQKHEIRNSKLETSTNVQNPEFKTGLSAGRRRFEPLNFEFVSDFEFRISNFLRVLVLAALLCLCLSCRVEQKHDPRWARIDTVVQEEIEAGHLPGAVVLVGSADQILYWKAFGWAVVDPFIAPMGKDTVFDLASLTKPVATAAAIMILIDRGQLDPNDRVGTYLPAFACSGKEDVRIRHLLAHTSGLPAYTEAKALKDQYGGPCPDQVVEKICSLSVQSAPDQQFRYSCLGYITLAQIVRAVTGQGIDEFTHDHLFAPLGMRHTRFCPPAGWQKNIAGTEIVDDVLLRGTVHDPLARLMAGISGNAGLFSTASDLSIFCRMLLHGGSWQGKQILSPAAVRMLTTVQANGRAYGFDVSSRYAWIKGPSAPPQAFCHSGYTGTSLVCDPTTGTYLILLTNSVHPHDKGTTKAIRSKIAEIVFPPAGGSGQT